MMMGRWWSLAWASAIVVCCGGTSLVTAEEPERVLHEFVPDAPGRSGRTGGRGASRGPDDSGESPSPEDRQRLLPDPDVEGGLPRAILRDGLGLLAPSGPPGPAAEELAYRPQGSAGAPRVREDRATQDRDTGADGQLHYHAVFNPSVAPFKRNAAFDRVLSDETLAVAGPSPPPDPVPAAPDDPAPELFWGSLALQLNPDTPTPLPSVAPGMRILELRTTPEVAVRVRRDSADNYWAHGPAGFEGTVRLVVLCEARAAYFGGPVPPFAAGDVPPPLRPSVPLAVRRRAQRVLARAGARATDSLDATLFRLVHYFRSFEPGSPPPQGDENSTYLDLALAQRGVCRHRAQAFVITAQSAGLAARYVHNEAHAFAEVYLPGAGWRRVDLGGASAGLTVHNGLGKIPHVPRETDPFPRPGPYRQSYSDQGGGPDASGEPAPRPGEQPRGERAAARPAAMTPASGRGAGQRPAAGDDGSQGAEPRAEAQGGAARAAAPAPEEGAAEPRVVATQGAPEGSPEAPADSGPLLPPPPLDVRVDAAATGGDGLQTFRGERFRIGGQVLDAQGQTVAGAPVAIVLRRRRGGPALQVLGLLVSGSEGRFGGHVPVPAELAAGRYEVDAVDARALAP